MSELICCCNSESWVEMIAWIQIVLNSVGLFGSIVSVTTVGIIFGTMDEKQEKWAEETFYFDEILGGVNERSWLGYIIAIILIIFFSILLVSFILGITYGIVLLRGVTQNKQSHVKSWLMYMKYYLAFYLLLSLTISYISNWSLAVIVVFTVFLLVICIYILIVYIFFRQLREQENTTRNEMELQQQEGTAVVEQHDNYY